MRGVVCLLLIFLPNFISAKGRLPLEYGDSALYQGLNVKLDVGNTVYTLIRNKGKIQSYEVSLNANLLKKYYPTVEFGYAIATSGAAAGLHTGQGGFMRVGMDLNPLRKGRNSDYALLVGLRLGWDVQQFQLTGVQTGDTYWRPGYLWDSPLKFRGDCWGELVAGLQIKVAGPVTMGWYVRMKFLLTRKLGDFKPYYIPGYGVWNDNNFGFNYYVGIRI